MDESQPVDELQETDDRSGELDGVHVRQLLALRRGAYRSRSHAIIAAVMCGFLAAAFLGVTVVSLQTRSLLWAALWLVIAVHMAIFCLHFIRRAKELTREIETPVPLPPASPGEPDFSTLSDGSQRWKNLENIE